jgi:hypothetical protein
MISWHQGGNKNYRWPLKGIFKGYAWVPYKIGTPRLNGCIGKGMKKRLYVLVTPTGHVTFLAF